MVLDNKIEHPCSSAVPYFDAFNPPPDLTQRQGGGNPISKAYQSLDVEDGPPTPKATQQQARPPPAPPFLSQHSTIDEEDDIIDEVMERSDEGPPETIYTSVR